MQRVAVSRLVSASDSLSREVTSKTSGYSQLTGGAPHVRLNRRFSASLVMISCISIGLGACSGIGGLIGFSKGKTSDEGGYSKRVVNIGEPVPKGGGRYKIGKPYKILGEWYYPKEDPRYDRIGIGSWYGDDFHGRYTANGEVYDMEALSAAHPTLPIPTYARVTNLQNGRSIVVRVNDRGPYKHNRVIDLSKRAAREIGYLRQGTARVRVQYLGKAPLNGDDRYEEHYLAQQRWRGSRYAARKQNYLAPMSYGSVANQTPNGQYPTQQPATPNRGSLFIKAGAFSNPDNAERMRQRLAAVGPVHITPQNSATGVIYRVTVGPFGHEGHAGTALQNVVNAGVSDAAIIQR